MKQQTKDKVLEQIQKQRRSQSRQKDHTITSLEFTSIVIEDFTNSIDEYLKNFNNLEHLQFRKCKIRSLNNLSDYNKIISLDLEENQLDESSLKQIVQHFPSLRFLNLRKNQIKDVSEFSHFKTLTQLTHLQLDKNPLTDTSEIWNWVPNLKALDGLDQNGKIVRDSDEEDDEDEEDIDDDESFSMDDEDDEDFDSEDDVSSSSNRKKKKKVKK